MSKTTPIQIDADEHLLKLLDTDAANALRTRKAQVMYIVTKYYKNKLNQLEKE